MAGAPRVRAGVWARRLTPVAVVGLLLFAGWILRRETRTFGYHDLVRALNALPTSAIVLGALLTMLSYGVLTLYDYLGLTYIGHLMRYGRIALASFIGYVFSYNIGLSVLGGGAVRYRLYSGWGLSTPDIARLIGFAGVTFWAGCLTLAGLVFVAEPFVFPSGLHIGLPSWVLGLVLLAIVAAYVMWAVAWRRPLRWRFLAIAPPSPRLVGAQLLLSTVDCALAACVLFVLLPSASGLSYAVFLPAYLAAIVAGLISHVPGGLGVFETVLLLLLGRYLPAPDLLGALFVYRIIYYLVPFALGATLLGAYELSQRTGTMAVVLRAAGRLVPELAPRALATTTFVGGVILLISGATPAVHDRLHFLARIVPLPVLELSHFAASVAGMALLILARGLQRRLDAAYHVSVLTLAAGVVFSLLKGADYEEATLLAIMLAALVPCRRHFYRHASLFSQRFSFGWVMAISTALAGSIWLGAFAFRHVEYSNDLFWSFALSADAPRFLRASVGAAVLAIAFGVMRLLRPSAGALLHPGPADLDRALAITQASTETMGYLALLGDKPLLFSKVGNAFLMYGVEGRSWVAAGDPVGPAAERRELAWQFRELSDRYGGWTVFYEVSAENVPTYLDLGLTLLKMGEEGRVPLAEFGLEGSERRELRNVIRRAERDGFVLRVLAPSEVPPYLDTLQAISESWLRHKHVREKGFSLGFFDRDYLRRLPVAIVERGGAPLAFANLWLSGQKEEASIDLMRHVAEAPRIVMDFLFVSLMMWAQKAGYRWFNLGMAPFSGIESRAAAPLWNRIGATLFQHGEHFYNFQGLRRYKEKFQPVWRPRYLASPGMVVLPLVMTNIAALTSRGLRGLINK